MSTTEDYTADVELIHNAAMEIADFAIACGDPSISKRMFEVASKAEFEAFRLHDEHVGSEPTRSILARSAASLALSAERYDLANERAFAGLKNSNAPQSIIDELYDVINQSQNHPRL